MIFLQQLLIFGLVLRYLMLFYGSFPGLPLLGKPLDPSMPVPARRLKMGLPSEAGTTISWRDIHWIRIPAHSNVLDVVFWWMDATKDDPRPWEGMGTGLEKTPHLDECLMIDVFWSLESCNEKVKS